MIRSLVVFLCLLVFLGWPAAVSVRETVQEVLNNSWKTEGTTGRGTLSGFTIYELDGLPSTFSDECVAALTATIECDLTVFRFGEPAYHGTLGDEALTDMVCQQNCGESLASWFGTAEKHCEGATLFDHPVTVLGGNMWTGWNETCYKDPETGQYCNDIISKFTRVARVELMPKDEMCSYCYTTKLRMMQSSQYSYYNEVFQHNLEVVMETCGITANTNIPADLAITAPEDDPLCVSGKTYTTKEGDTCTSIALEHSVSSAALYMGNQDLIRDCQQVVVGKDLCLPLSCERTYVLQPNDTCRSIEDTNADVLFDKTTKFITPIRQLNPWIDTYCTNLQSTAWAFGRVLCLSPQGGVFDSAYPVDSSYNPWGTESSGEGRWLVDPPRSATLAAGTTKRCGKWHTAVAGETCAQICMRDKTTSILFLAVNPSLDPADCTASLTPGLTYCTAPMPGWNYTVEGQY